MADHMLCDRTPDEVMTDFDTGSEGRADIDMRDILWQVIDTVRDSYALALRGCEHPLTASQIREVETTVDDFVANAFGDD